MNNYDTKLIYINFNFSYKLRIDCMLLKEEFTANMSYLTPSINSMLCAGNGWFIICLF